MEDLKQDIERLEKELAYKRAKLEESKRNKLELEDFDGYIVFGNGVIEDSYKGQSKSYLKAGRKRKTKALAEELAMNSRERDLLEAYARQIDPDWVADFGDVHQAKYFIYYDYSTGKYVTVSTYSHRIHGVVYMSKETAEIICDALNNGEIEL